MGTSISTRIMAFNGQCVNQIYYAYQHNALNFTGFSNRTC